MRCLREGVSGAVIASSLPDFGPLNVSGCFSARRLRGSALLTILVLLLVHVSSSHAQKSSPKNVLVLYSGQTRDHESFDLMVSAIRAHVADQVNFSVAYLDYQKLNNKAYRES